MKVFGVLIGLGVVGLGLWWWVAREMGKEGDMPIAVVFGDLKGESIEINLAVEMGMENREGPRVDAANRVLWDEWVVEHFKIRDDAGGEAELSRVAQSALMDITKLPGAPEFCLKGRLTCGKQYTFDYIPHRAETKCYRWKFAAPSGPQKMQRAPFTPTEK
jgi:hypothetical protein